jgi:hypothetical protein
MTENRTLIGSQSGQVLARPSLDCPCIKASARSFDQPFAEYQPSTLRPPTAREELAAATSFEGILIWYFKRIRKSPLGDRRPTLWSVVEGEVVSRRDRCLERSAATATEGSDDKPLSCEAFPLCLRPIGTAFSSENDGENSAPAWQRLPIVPETENARGGQDADMSSSPLLRRFR